MSKETEELEALIKNKFNLIINVHCLTLLSGEKVLAFISISPKVLNENPQFESFINMLRKYVTHNIDYMFYNPFVLDLNKCSIEMIKTLLTENF